MTEFVRTTDGLRIAYERVGEGPPVVLVHGFASSKEQNWKSTGWYGSLTEAGFSVVAIDNRGHGESDKPHDSLLYHHDRMAEDVLTVMDATGVKSAPYVGYSMGGLIGLRFLALFPDRITRLALGGVGETYLTGPRVSDPERRDMIAEALLTDDKDSITDPRARMFRDFAEQKGKDRLALAACMRAMSPPLPVPVLQSFDKPILVVDGDQDFVAGPAGPLAATFLHGTAAIVPGRDHMSAVGARPTRQAVVDFLKS
ncbi:MAG TPA: alpha/beta hydrolase [Rhizomicrobium sp.]|jgi:pimeloyl-ACP methyl ester carboxylesterase